MAQVPSRRPSEARRDRSRKRHQANGHADGGGDCCGHSPVAEAPFAAAAPAASAASAEQVQELSDEMLFQELLLDCPPSCCRRASASPSSTSPTGSTEAPPGATGDQVPCAASLRSHAARFRRGSTDDARRKTIDIDQSPCLVLRTSPLVWRVGSTLQTHERPYLLNNSFFRSVVRTPPRRASAADRGGFQNPQEKMMRLFTRLPCAIPAWLGS